MIPPEVHKEWSKWIRQYPMYGGTVEEANKIFKRARQRFLQQLSKEYKVPLKELEDYYHL
jgi:hypothetical protein